MIETRPIQDSDHAAIVGLANLLADWFDEDARTRAIPADLRHQQGYVSVSGERIVGFITLFFAEGRINIGWLGVHPNDHRKGIGTELLDCAEEFGRMHGVSEIATYTLGEGVDYKPYEMTRRFYFGRGFKIYQSNRTDNPNCLEEIRIMKPIAQPFGSGNGASDHT